jgi:hypothetical protein
MAASLLPLRSPSPAQPQAAALSEPRPERRSPPSRARACRRAVGRAPRGCARGAASRAGVVASDPVPLAKGEAMFMNKGDPEVVFGFKVKLGDATMTDVPRSDGPDGPWPQTRNDFGDECSYERHGGFNKSGAPAYLYVALQEAGIEAPMARVRAAQNEIRWSLSPPPKPPG